MTRASAICIGALLLAFSWAGPSRAMGDTDNDSSDRDLPLPAGDAGEVTIQFQAHRQETAGGLFDLRTLSNSAAPDRDGRPPCGP